MSILQLKVTRQEWLERLKSNNDNTARSYDIGIGMWDQFLESINHTDEAMLLELRKHQSESDTYLFLDRYVGYLAKQGIKHNTMKLYFAALRSWCAVNGIMLFNEYIKRFVKFPKPLKETKVSLTPEKIKLLIDNAPKGVRVILFVLLSSGMRISEVLQLKVGDIDMNTNPVKIKVRAETTKTKEQRTAYMSYESKMAITPYLIGKNKDDLIFVKEVKRSNLISFENRFAKLRKQVGLLDKYDDDKNHHVNVHAFRAYFHTQATKVLGGDIAHALIGHKAYLDQYFRLEDKEKGELYHKLEPHISVSNEAIQKGIIEQKDKQLARMSEMEQEIIKLKAYNKRKEKLSSS